MESKGGCLCGAIRYEVQGEPLRVFGCHCRDCQKSSGSVMHLGIVFARSNLAILTGEPASYAHKGDSGRKIVRHFCANCGSGIYNEPEVIPDAIVLKWGSLDDASSVSPSYELYTRSKPDWLELASVDESFATMRS